MTVYDGTEIPMPPVKSYCRLCARCWVYESEDDYAVVSPSGVKHIGGDYGFTACGFDATGPTWWWPL
jgi:hypothetical protein